MDEIYRLTKEEARRCNPPDVETRVVMFSADAEPIAFVKELLDERWLPVGYIPTRQTRRGWFAYHLVHGMWMRYPFWKVLLYALFESRQ